MNKPKTPQNQSQDNSSSDTGLPEDYQQLIKEIQGIQGEEDESSQKVVIPPAPPAQERKKEEAKPTPKPVKEQPVINGQALKDLANQVARALVELDNLKAEKDALEKQLTELQRKHDELDQKIKEHRQKISDLLKQVQTIIG